MIPRDCPNGCGQIGQVEPDFGRCVKCGYVYDFRKPEKRRKMTRSEWDVSVSSPTWVSPPLHAAITPETWERLKTFVNALLEYRERTKQRYPDEESYASLVEGDVAAELNDIAKELGLE